MPVTSKIKKGSARAEVEIDPEVRIALRGLHIPLSLTKTVKKQKQKVIEVRSDSSDEEFDYRARYDN